jgi:hypothetical protein
MNIFIPDVAIAERIVRTVVGYRSLLVASRLAGARQAGHLSVNLRSPSP